RRREVVFVAVGSVEMTQRDDERLVCVHKGGNRRDRAPADHCCPLVILVEQICYRIGGFEAENVRVERRQLEVMVETLQGRLGLAVVAVSQRAQSPDERYARVKVQGAVEMIKSRVELLCRKRAVVPINSQRLGIVRTRLHRPQGKIPYAGKFLP